ncbi:hypothetical protein MAPG_05576 [Magnaporthiopsis poae ATCC 64411]|uniref:Uncharacterized protein n=1 Tax=Magnaporthiopsis poae (strain ATCC 64411 / 73-15) TaxID=644358 RepID=A0A0C4DZS0_MAGP6|nr:hypothetical protein MAPG_05576 [Magnaporthiopsis poae ATCC 64411]
MAASQPFVTIRDYQGHLSAFNPPGAGQEPRVSTAAYIRVRRDGRTPTTPAESGIVGDTQQLQEQRATAAAATTSTTYL